MISKWRISLIMVMLLLLIGFSGQKTAMAVPGDNGLFCPGSINVDGWLELDLSDAPPLQPADFRGGLIGTMENVPGAFERVGGIDWMHNNRLNSFGVFDQFGELLDEFGLGIFVGINPFPTNWPGAQLVGPWSQTEGKNTAIQITNPWILPIGVHVHILDSDCEEALDFCDYFSPYDTHVYDFGAIMDNPDIIDGIIQDPNPNVPSGNLQGKEGFVTVTAVLFCDNELSDVAVQYNHLIGDMYMSVGSDVIGVPEYEYGAHMYARRAFDLEDCEEVEDLGCFSLYEEFSDEIIANLDFLDGILAFLEPVRPSELEGQYNQVYENGAGADVILINFFDNYFSGQEMRFQYQPDAAFTSVAPDDWDIFEDPISCGDAPFCYVRLGINDENVLSDDYPIPAPPTTSPTSVTPTTPPTTPPTTTGGGGGGNKSSSCAIAGNPIQLGTAFANVLIPLIPLAFVFGIRAIRRRKK